MNKTIKLMGLTFILFIITLSFCIINKQYTENNVKAANVDNPTLSIYKKNLSYSSELYIMYAVEYDGFDPNLYPVKMLFYDSLQEGYTKENATYVVNPSGSTTIAGVNCLIYYSRGLAAKQMTDDIYARAYVEIDDKIIYSEVVKYSVLEYVYEATGKVNENIENLLFAMKEYGAKAQINFNYNLDRLANATYYNINVINGTLSDGFTQGRFQLEEEITIKANPSEEGMRFVHWIDKNEKVVSDSSTIQIQVSGDNTYEAVYTDSASPILTIDPSLETIKLNWNKEVTKEFLLQGVSSIDDIDGDITDDVQITHQINNRKYGTYVVTYTSTDSSGNISTVQRNVEVVWDYAVQFIGHQGSYYGAPNSEEAFLYAAETLQYQALETDVKQTKDGVFVCCHDDTFGGLTIANTNWADLKDVVISSSRTAGYPSQYGEMPGTGKYTAKICTLERYLEICKEYGIKAVVELKGSPGISNSDQSGMPALMELIEQEDMLDQTIFLASAYNCLIWVKQNGYDYIPCQYLVDSFASETVFNRCKTYGLDVSGCVTYGNGQTENTAEWVVKYQDAGIKVSTYTFTQYSDYSDV